MNFMKIVYFTTLLVGSLLLANTSAIAECVVGQNGYWKNIDTYYCAPRRSECVYGYSSVDNLEGARKWSDEIAGNTMHRYLNYLAWCNSFPRCPYLGGEKATSSRPYHTKHFTYYRHIYVWVCKECLTTFYELSAKCGGDDQILNWDSETCEGTCKEDLDNGKGGGQPPCP